MTLHIQNDPIGTDSFLPAEAFIDLVRIANMDAGIGQDPPAGGTSRVTFARDPTNTGAPPVQLDALVNTAFPDPVGTVDIVVMAVDDSYITPDGLPITSAAGIAWDLEDPNNPLSGTAASTAYDTSECNGDGWYVFDVNGDPIPFPRPAILYHELWHCFEQCTNVLDHPYTATELADGEVRAETAENAMRDLLGLAHRDVNSHAGGCGTGPEVCCIVASIATGSPLSAEVNALRRLRDHFVRPTEVGFDFFREFFDEYYGVSPEVCRLMAVSQPLRAAVERWFVLPLLGCVETLRAYLLTPDDADAIGQTFLSGLARHPSLAALSAEDRVLARAVLSHPATLVEHPDQTLHALSRLLAERAWQSAILRWSLFDLLDTYAAALDAHAEGARGARIGRLFQARFEPWCAGLPITAVWSRLTETETREALAFLDEVLLRSPPARATFAQRLMEATNSRPATRSALGSSGSRSGE